MENVDIDVERQAVVEGTGKRRVMVNQFGLKKREKHAIYVFLTVLFIVASVLLWFLEHDRVLPLKQILPSVAPGANRTTIGHHVISKQLSGIDKAHREGYGNNLYLKLMDRYRQETNRSNCWLCSLLPHDSASSTPLSSLPFPLLATCYALIEGWVRGRAYMAMAGGGQIDYTAVQQFDKDILGSLSCSVYWGADNLNTEELLYKANNSFEHKDLINETFGLQAPQSTKLSASTMPPATKVMGTVHYAMLCVKSSGTVSMGNLQECEDVVDIPQADMLYLGGELRFICGQNAYPWLPSGWGGTCAIGILFPTLHIIEPREAHDKFHQHYGMDKMVKREVVDQTDTAGQILGDIAKGLVPMLGIGLNSRDIRRLSRIWEATINETVTDILNIMLEMSAIRQLSMQNRFVLDTILAKEGGACRILGPSCCSYVSDSAPTIFKSLEKLHLIAGSLHYDNGVVGESWFVSLLKEWGWKLFVPVMTFFAIMCGCCCCIQCLPILLSSFSKFGVRMLATMTPLPVDAADTNAKIMLQFEIQRLMDIKT